MNLFVKTLLFAVIGMFGGGFLSLPFRLISEPVATIVHYVVWAGFIAYPAYEHYFIRSKRHEEIDEDSRINAYIRFIKTRKFINYVRFICAFAVSLLLTVILSVIGYHLELQGEGDAHPVRLALSVFLLGWLGFYQLIRFGIDKNLALTSKDEVLISLEEYNKIEHDIVKLNASRRRTFLCLILAMVVLIYLVQIYNNTGAAAVAMIVFILALVAINGAFKTRFKRTIFPHIRELKDLRFHNVNHSATARNLKTKYHHPIISEKLNEKTYSDSYLEYKDDEGRTNFQLWERSSGIHTYMVISTLLKKPVENEVYLSTDNIARKVKKDEIINATHQFSDIFKLFSDDNVLAYAFMTPIVQENFLKLIANANAQNFHCSVQKDEMVIVMRCGGDLFEVGSLFQKITLDSINNTIAEIRLAKSLPEFLSF